MKQFDNNLLNNDKFESGGDIRLVVARASDSNVFPTLTKKCETIRTYNSGQYKAIRAHVGYSRKNRIARNVGKKKIDGSS